MSTFCVKCKRVTTTLKSVVSTTNNNRSIEKGICQVCGIRKSRFLPNKFGTGVFNALLNKLPLPEMHLNLPSDVPSEYVPGGEFNAIGKYSYCGPFTKLQQRLKQG